MKKLLTNFKTYAWIYFTLSLFTLFLFIYFTSHPIVSDGSIQDLTHDKSNFLTWSFILHTACLIILFIIAIVRGFKISKNWIFFFPLIASIIDLIPILTSNNVSGIYLGMSALISLSLKIGAMLCMW